MKKNFLNLFFALGWILFLLSIIFGTVLKKFSSPSESNIFFTPIAWEDFEGALSCSLTSDELMERKKELKEEIFPKVIKRVELTTGFIYYFEDEPKLAEKIMEFIAKEKQCCPFFKFDLSILPFEKGMAFQISGSEGVKAFLVAEGVNQIGSFE